MRSDWDCKVCSQPNSSEDSICINCESPFDINSPNAEKLRGEFLSSNLEEDNAIISNEKDKTTIVPTTKYLYFFPPTPTFAKSIEVFAFVYLILLCALLSLFTFTNLGSSVSNPILMMSSAAVSQYWRRSNMLAQLQETKWPLIISCLLVTLIFDFFCLMLGLDLYHLKFLTSILTQKLVNIFILWLIFSTNFLSYK